MHVSALSTPPDFRFLFENNVIEKKFPLITGKIAACFFIVIYS